MVEESTIKTCMHVYITSPPLINVLLVVKFRLGIDMEMIRLVLRCYFFLGFLIFGSNL